MLGWESLNSLCCHVKCSASSSSLPNPVALPSYLLPSLQAAAALLVCTQYDSNFLDLFSDLCVFVSVFLLAVLGLSWIFINLLCLFLPYSSVKCLLFFSSLCNSFSFLSPLSLPTPKFVKLQYCNVINFSLPCPSVPLLQFFLSSYKP